MESIILGIESSCDDTSAAVLKDGKIVSNLIASQDVHKEYGGVVPELASRAHQENIVPVVHEALKMAKVSKEELNAIAVTVGPGLMGPLLVGSSFAKSMAFALGIPIIGVNHMQAHVLSHFIEDPKPDFPFLCLTVSGGHTQIVLVKDHLQMEVVGQTTDDAAGEAFDKTAKIMGLDYPGGPLIDKYARDGDKHRFKFPEPDIAELNFSFSGLKTAILYFLQENMANDKGFIENNMNDICASVQHRIVSILMNKMIKASKQFDIQDIAIAGGVSANSELRKMFDETGREQGWRTFIPKFEYCTDNAAMIAITGYYKYLQGNFEKFDFTPQARMAIT